MARLHLTHANGIGNRFSDLVAYGVRPAGTGVPDDPPGAGWADERAAELQRQGIDASVMRVPGEPPVVTYRIA